MITLTTPTNIPNINRLRVNKVLIDQDASIAYINVVATQIGGNIYGTYQLQVVNGSSQGLRANGAPTGPNDALQLFTLTTATGFTDMVSAYNGNGSLATKNQAVETACIADGLLPAGTVS